MVGGIRGPTPETKSVQSISPMMPRSATNDIVQSGHLLSEAQFEQLGSSLPSRLQIRISSFQSSSKVVSGSFLPRNLLEVILQSSAHLDLRIGQIVDIHVLVAFAVQPPVWPRRLPLGSGQGGNNRRDGTSYLAPIDMRIIASAQGCIP